MPRSASSTRLAAFSCRPKSRSLKFSILAEINLLDKYCPAKLNPILLPFKSPFARNSSDELLEGRRYFGRPFLCERYKGFGGQRCQHQSDHMIKALVPRLPAEEIATEDHAQGCAVRQIEKAQRGNRNIKLHRIDDDDEVAALNASPHHRSNHFDERRMH